MKKICLPLTILAMLLKSRNPVNAKDFRKVWLSLPREVRTWYVGGFRNGYSHAYVHYGRKTPEVGKDQVSGGKDPEKLPIKVSGLDYEVIADTMTELYRDPANRMIPYNFICNLAIDKLRGATTEEVNRSLEMARRSLTESPEPGQ